jgi:transposase
MRTEKKLWRNRKAKKELARRLQSENPGLEVVHPQAAGIDVGNSAHYVAVRPHRDPEPVRRFECFTADLHRLADWLQSCGVKTVALQSTGVYWIPLYDILEERGLEVYHRTDDRAGHRRRGTRPVEAGGTQSSADSGQPMGDGQKPGRQLAPGADLCAATGNRNVRHLPATRRGM